MAWVDPTEQVNGNVLDDQLWNQDVVANTLAIFRHLNPVGTVIPYAGDWGDPNAGYPGLADPDVGAPFHLPCTGGVYETDDFPLLSRVLTKDGIDAATGRPYPEGHLFVDGIYGAPSHGMVESGQDINGHAGGHSDPFWDEGGGSLTGDATAWRPDTSLWLFQDGATAGSDLRGWHRITMKGFATPDFRGRSPIGAGGEGVAREWALGERFGDRHPGWHLHDLQYNRETQTYVGPSDGGTTNYGIATVAGASGNAFRAAGAAGDGNANGAGGNYHPSTGVNWLVFTGQVVQSHAPKSTNLRDGSAYRIQPVTTEQMIHQRLADPDLSDEEREMWEAQLNGELLPPMPEEVS